VTTRAAHPSGEHALDSDLGWALGIVFRHYLKAAGNVMADVPGGPRGYQVLAEAAGNQADTQLALAHRLGIDRTVMTYLLDDLENAGLVERRADPADRRARRIVATGHGQARLAELDTQLRRAEEHVLAALAEGDRDTFRDLLRQIATHAHAQDPVASRCQVVQEVAEACPPL
jgi:DNA-binding MarR family transcriptional regulator